MEHQSAPRELTEDEPQYVVTGAPEAIWLCLGDLSTGAMPGEIPFDECESSGEVTWCNDAQDNWDVKYVRADLVAAPSPQTPVSRATDEAVHDDHPVRHWSRTYGQTETCPTCEGTGKVNPPVSQADALRLESFRKAIHIAESLACDVPVTQETWRFLNEARAAYDAAILATKGQS